MSAVTATLVDGFAAIDVTITPRTVLKTDAGTAPGLIAFLSAQIAAAEISESKAPGVIIAIGAPSINVQVSPAQDVVVAIDKPTILVQVAESIRTGGGGSGIKGSAAISATLAPGDIDEFVFTVTGVALGNPCLMPGFLPALPQGVFAQCHVSAADTVTVTLANFTALTQVIAATVNVEVHP